VDSEIVLNEIADKIICPYGRDVSILPDELLFAYTYEYIKMPKKMAGHIEARARLAKLGLIVSSGIIDPGFSDHILLSFFNAGKFPINIRPLTRVVSLTLEKINTVKHDFQNRPLVREKLDPDHLVLSIPDYDSLALKTFNDILSDNV
jgi:deoxycytidine triphosphate deaminase